MTIEKKVPEMRFPEFSSDWVLMEIGQFLVEYKERVPASTNIPILTSSREGLFPQKSYFDNREVKNDGEYGVVPRGYFCYRHMSDDSTFKFNINNLFDKGAISKEYPVFTTKNINSYFLQQLLNEGNAFKRFARAQKLGGTRVRLYYKKLSKLKLKLPTLPEQQKIATFLTAVDTKIQQLTKKKALLEQYKKGVMQRIFKQEIRFKDENGADFPEWEERKLGTLTYKTGKKNKENIKYPIYSINNKEGFLPQSDQFEGMDSNERGYDISMYKIIKENTFAYNPARINVGSIGFSGKLNDIIVSSLYVCFKTTEKLDDQYLLHYLDTFDFNKAVLRNAEGGVRSYLFYENFSIIKIPLPSLKEQKKIADFLSKLDNKAKQVNIQLNQVQQFKKGLLQKMFV